MKVESYNKIECENIKLEKNFGGESEVLMKKGLDIMLDEKMFADDALSEEELDGVAGGTRLETYADGNELYKRGLISEDDAGSSSKVREALHNLGYKYQDHGGAKLFGAKDNEYFNKDGVSVKRDDFWKNFDAENGTKIIR